MDHSRTSNVFLKMERTLWINVAGILLLCLISVNGYSKYGRSCKDIGCASNEVCEMAQDPCTLYERNNCGNYPTCVRKDNSASAPSCVTMRCPSGKYCKTENGQPTCVNTLPGLAPAARRPGGSRRRVVTQRPTIPTPPPRSSSFGHGGRYPSYPSSNSIGGRDSIWGFDFGGSNDRNNHGNRNSGHRGQNIDPKSGGNYHNTHVSTDSRGNRVWTFSG